MSMYLPDLRHPVHRFAHRSIDFSKRVALMAIINRTPDSFYDSGATFALGSAVDAALGAVDAGADWIDIGGVPFSPGPALSWQEEAQRIVPVIEAVRAQSDVVISADTFTAGGRLRRHCRRRRRHQRHHRAEQPGTGPRGRRGRGAPGHHALACGTAHRLPAPALRRRGRRGRRLPAPQGRAWPARWGSPRRRSSWTPATT